MARVSKTDVKAIMDTDVELNAFIIAADLVIDDLLLDQGYSGAHLKEIARWLSAHFACTLDPRVESEKVAGADVKYAFPILRSAAGLGLNASPYGQQVLVLDTSGALNDVGKVASVIESIPTKYS
jgi:hypothetical protein